MIEAIAKLPRLNLGCFPTPLVEARRLSEVLGGPRILVKRDDLCGLALGGNKCRHLEYLMGDARAKGIDAFVLGAASNLSIQLEAAAAKLGFKTKYILYDDDTYRKKQGNYLLHRILDSDMIRMEPIDPSATSADKAAKLNAAYEREADNLRKEGYNPFIRREFEYPPVARVGWVNGADEIRQQLKDQGISAQYLVTTVSQGGTYAGLAVGTKYLGNPFKLIGITDHYTREEATSKIVKMANATAEFLELGITIAPEELTLYDDYTGEGYGEITGESIEAIKLVAKTEGFFLDPVYTGKAMAGLIDLIKKGYFKSADTVVFIHTGGLPYLFVHSEAFTG